MTNKSDEDGVELVVQKEEDDEEEDSFWGTRRYSLNHLATILIGNSNKDSRGHQEDLDSVDGSVLSQLTSATHDKVTKMRRFLAGGNDDEEEEDDFDEDTVASLKKIRYPSRPPPVCAWWTSMTEDVLHKTLLKWVVALACHASRYPKRYVGAIVFLSCALMGIGLLTNFDIKFDHEDIFTPIGSLPAKHGKWLYGESGFEDDSEMMLVIHSNGDNVLNMDAVLRAFEALDTVQSTPGYDEVCKSSDYIGLDGDPTCWIWSSTQFWDHDVEQFEDAIKNYNDLAFTMSQDEYPDGTPVYKEASYGKYLSEPAWFMDKKNRNQTYDLLTYVPNFMISVGLPDTVESESFQEVVLERLKYLQRKWELQDMQHNPLAIRLEFFTMHAYLLEYERALFNDMPLVPLVFYVMLLFTCFVFHKFGQGTAKDSIMYGADPSRFTLGILSTFTIGMSLLSGYGFMFCVGVPFTNIAQMIPFIILGVGLDDTFIIMGAYFRLLAEDNEKHKRCETVQDENAQITNRIRETLEEVGLSITLTTATTVFAFCLGSMSTIPGIRWVCLYASVTIFFDYIYQVTLFIALLTLDERRMNRARANATTQGKYMLIGGLWGTLADSEKEANNTSKDSESIHSASTSSSSSSLFAQRIMSWYGKQLLRPVSKAIVLMIFAATFGYSIYRTTLLTQEFNIEDYVPEDSYTKPFFNAIEEYASIKVPIQVYFRNVNQSDPLVQDQMRAYIDELSELPQIQHPPDFCWVRDVHSFLTGEAIKEMDEDEAREAQILADAVQSGNKTFTEQMNIVLSIATLRDVYGGDIVRDEDGTIIASRCYLFARYIDLHSVQEQVALLHAQEEITARYQPQLTSDERKMAKGLSFFTFDDLYYYWELYTVAVEELVFTTISGVIAVCVIGFVLIPHWSAIMFVFPIIMMLYFNLLGTLQFFGIHINAVTYVTIVIAIGLLVDFLMHILLRYYESPGATRDAKVIDTLETMGASMLMGGFTTWLGVIPLVLSSTAIFNTIFIAFIAMVSWGLLTSLVLMPVILSLFGPLICTIGDRLSKKEAQKIKKSQQLEKLTTVPPVLRRPVDNNSATSESSKEGGAVDQDDRLE